MLHCEIQSCNSLLYLSSLFNGENHLSWQSSVFIFTDPSTVNNFLSEKQCYCFAWAYLARFVKSITKLINSWNFETTCDFRISTGKGLFCICYLQFQGFRFTKPLPPTSSEMFFLNCPLFWRYSIHRTKNDYIIFRWQYKANNIFDILCWNPKSFTIFP